MKFLILLKSNLKRMLKNKRNIIISFLLPTIVLLVLGFIFNKTTGSGNEYENAIINSDKGTYGTEFIKEIEKNTSIKIYEKADGIEKVKKKRIALCYEIPENFSELILKCEKPQIISHKTENGQEPGNFQFNANSVVNKMLITSEFKANGREVSLQSLSYEGINIKVIGKDKKSISDVIILHMILSFVLYSAIGMSLELFELKKQNILKRSFTTSNKPKTIVGGILSALFIISAIGFSGLFLLSAVINSPNSLKNAPVIILNIMFLVLLALSLGVFITRIIKNESLIGVVLQIIIAVTCFVGGCFMPYELLPKSISIFSKFTPQYWALESINTGNPWLAFIVVLFSLVLFTAGTFRMKNFME